MQICCYCHGRGRVIDKGGLGVFSLEIFTQSFIGESMDTHIQDFLVSLRGGGL